MTNHCPNCKSDLQGEPIPKEYLKDYGGATHYDRKIGIYDIDADRVIFYVCPDCDERIERDT